MTVLYWLIIAGVMLVLEIMTMGLTTIWFTGGALVAAVCSYLNMSMWIQFLVFLLVSVLLLVLTRSLVMDRLNSRTVKTNAESLIGQICIVTEEINNLYAKGQVKVKGQTWTARSFDDDVLIPIESRVKILRISGVKLIVKPQEKEE